jgi:hypothetical protein
MPIEEFHDITRQRYAVGYQERGGWGGDDAFADAYELLMRKIRADERAVPRRKANVVWWPDDERFLSGKVHTSGMFFRMDWLEEKTPPSSDEKPR